MVYAIYAYAKYMYIHIIILYHIIQKNSHQSLQNWPLSALNSKSDLGDIMILMFLEILYVGELCLPATALIGA